MWQNGRIPTESLQKCNYTLTKQQLFGARDKFCITRALHAQMLSYSLKPLSDSIRNDINLIASIGAFLTRKLKHQNKCIQGIYSASVSM